MVLTKQQAETFLPPDAHGFPVPAQQTPQRPAAPHGPEPNTDPGPHATAIRPELTPIQVV